jgi:hypothetical protein
LRETKQSVANKPPTGIEKSTDRRTDQTLPSDESKALVEFSHSLHGRDRFAFELRGAIS